METEGARMKMSQDCEKCQKAMKKYKEIIKKSDSIFDAASDFQIFVEECQKKCRKHRQNT